MHLDRLVSCWVKYTEHGWLDIEIQSNSGILKTVGGDSMEVVDQGTQHKTRKAISSTTHVI